MFTIKVVRDVKEVYIDYLPLGAHMFGLSIPHPLQPLGSRWEESSLARTAQAVTALLLALKLCPGTVGLHSGSAMSKLVPFCSYSPKIRTFRRLALGTTLQLESRPITQ